MYDGDEKRKKNAAETSSIWIFSKTKRKCVQNRAFLSLEKEKSETKKNVVLSGRIIIHNTSAGEEKSIQPRSQRWIFFPRPLKTACMIGCTYKKKWEKNTISKTSLPYFFHVESRLKKMVGRMFLVEIIIVRPIRWLKRHFVASRRLEEEKKKKSGRAGDFLD